MPVARRLPVRTEHRARSALVRLALLASLALSLIVPAGTTGHDPGLSGDANTPPGPAADTRLASIPLSFEENLGQTAPEVRFITRTGAQSVFFGTDGIVMASVPPVRRGAPEDIEADPFASREVPEDTGEVSVVSMHFTGADRSVEPEGLGSQETKTNYIRGNDPASWHTDIPNYDKVLYEGLYPGIDAIFYDNGNRALEYDFVVAPGTDPAVISLGFSGHDDLYLNRAGDLMIATTTGELRQPRPYVYQELAGAREEVEGGFVIRSDEVGFVLGQYDPARPLIIDPELIYSSYLGGTTFGDRARSVDVDLTGSAYVMGETISTDFPTTPGAYQTALANPPGGWTWSDVFVTKINPEGSGLIYSTYLGGNWEDTPHDLAVDAEGGAVVVGRTRSTDFPAVSAIQPTYGGAALDGFVTKLNPSGTALTYSSYLGGSGIDYAYGVDADESGSTYVTARSDSPNFPVTPGAYQTSIASGAADATATKLSPAGSLIYSTYLGSVRNDLGTGIAVDSAGNAYVAGQTASETFPVLNAFQPLHASFAAGNVAVYDGFITKLNATGSALIYSSFLGGSTADGAAAVAVDSAGSAYVTGVTVSYDFPTTPGSFQPAKGGSRDAFITKVNPSGSSVAYSSHLGGSGDESVTFDQDVAVDGTGSAYVACYTRSSDFPTTPDALQPTHGGPLYGEDGFVTKVNPSGSALTYSTYLGGGGSEDRAHGVAVDTSANAYVVGQTQSADFPIRNAFQPTCAGCADSYTRAFITKIDTSASRSYLAEGATAGGFETWILLTNPDPAESATAQLTFLTATGPVAGPVVSIPAQSRRSVRAGAYVTGYDISTVVVGLDRRVVAERALYSTSPGYVGAHLGKEVTETADSWFLAEGASKGGFETWVLVANPDTVNPANVAITYLTDSGPVTGPAFVLGPQSRKSVRVNDTVSTYDVSTKVTSTGTGVIAERSTYVGHGVLKGATASPGSPAPAPNWFLAEGASEGGFETWVLVANPDTVNSANVAITYLTDSGPVTGPAFVLGPQSRKSVRVNDTVSTYDVSTKVTSTGTDVVVERAQYSNHPLLGQSAASGEGVVRQSESWLFAEGASAGGFETWVLVANPDTVNPANVAITYLTDSGPVTGPAFVLGPQSRKSVRVNDTVSTYDVSTKVTSTGTGVIADHSVYSPPGISHDSTGGPGIAMD